MVLVEACVTTLEEAEKAFESGANRLELCVNLDVGGLTPHLELVADVLETVDLPLAVMIRPRAGSFHMNAQELARMERDVTRIADAGADGIVLGVLDAQGQVDVAALSKLVDAADPVPVTFHRAFDGVADPVAALEDLIEAGVDRVLTAGGAGTAWEGRDVLASLVEAAGGRITIMAGGSIRADHVADLVEITGVEDIHARASAIADLMRVVRPA